MTLTPEPRNWDERTGHVAPVAPGSQTYVAHIEGRRSIVADHADPFACVEDAVAWARHRAPVVLVRLSHEEFLRSAGERPFAEQPDLPPWPVAR